MRRALFMGQGSSREGTGRRPRLWVWTLLVVLALVLAACAEETTEQDPEAPATTEPADEADAPEEPTDEPDEPEALTGGVVIYGMWEDPDSLDATFSFTGGANRVYGSMCETLYDLDENNQIVPLLAAELPVVSDDGLTMTIPVRQDATFNDGTPFNAEAVRVTLEKHMTSEGSNRTGDLGPVDSVEAVDEFTVQLNLNAAAAGPVTGVLVMQAGVMQSPAQIEALGDNFTDHPVCVGPFQFVERVPGDRVVLERSEHYYDADNVFLDGVVFRIIEDHAVRAANLRAGDLHISDTILAADLPALDADADFVLYSEPWLGFDALYINISNAAGRDQPPGEVDTPLARDPRIREALELSLDRNALNEILYNGYYIPGCTPLSPSHPFHVDVTCVERDLDRAQELLEEAGEPNPVVELLVRNAPEHIQTGELLKSQIEEAGFTVNIQPRDTTAAVNAYFEGEYEFFQNGWTGRIDPDANLFGWHARAEGALNPFFGMGDSDDPTDQQITQLLEQGRSVFDFDERYDLYTEAIELIMERRNSIVLFHRNHFVAVSTDVEGFAVHGDLRPRFVGVTLNN